MDRLGRTSTTKRMTICHSCLRVAGSGVECTCGNSNLIELSHEVGKALSSIKGKNKAKKQRKAVMEYLQAKARKDAEKEINKQLREKSPGTHWRYDL